MHHQLVITGTGTDVGKTLVAACLTLGTHGHYWKPVQSGCAPENVMKQGDRGAVMQMTGLPASHFYNECYCLPEPLSPHRAAELARQEIDIDAVQQAVPQPTNGPLIIEGAGGLLVPLTRKFLFADLFARWQFPIIIVTSTELGTINHTLLTIEAAKARHIPILGLVFNGNPNPDNLRTITEFSGVPAIGYMPHLPVINSAVLSETFRAFFDHDTLGTRHLIPVAA